MMDTEKEMKTMDSEDAKEIQKLGSSISSDIKNKGTNILYISLEKKCGFKIIGYQMSIGMCKVNGIKAYLFL